MSGRPGPPAPPGPQANAPRPPLAPPAGPRPRPAVPVALGPDPGGAIAEVRNAAAVPLPVTPGTFDALRPADKTVVQLMYDSIDHWWRGPEEYVQWIRDNGNGLRVPAVRNMKFPRKVRKESQPKAGGRPLGPGLGFRPRRRIGPRVGAAAGLREFEHGIQHGRFGIVPSLRGTGFRLKRVLGRGGFGCAALFQMDDVDGKAHKVVIKASTGGDLGPEIHNMRVSRWPLTRYPRSQMLQPEN